MKKILLYSDFKTKISQTVHDFLLDDISETAHRVCYVPSDSDLKRRYFEKVLETYHDIGVSDVMYFDLNEEYQPENIPNLLECDVLHLSGGDTEVFLKLIKHRGFKQVINDFLNKGGLVVGVSAGAMLLAQHIELCNEFSESKTRIKNTKSLGLLPFEFFPHFDGHSKTEKKLLDYTLKHKCTVYACADDEGVFYNGENAIVIGDVVVFQNGQILKK